MNDSALIPRAHFFGNPARRRPVISPDGRWIAWLAPVDGVANIWIAERERPEDARPLTFDKGRGPGAPAFAQDGRHLLFLKDADGDENTHVYALDIETGAIRDLTPLPGARCGVMAASRLVPDSILVRINDHDPRFHDIYSIEIATGRRTLVERNDAGYAGYWADSRHVLRLARLSRSEGGAVVRRRDKAGSWVDWLDIPADDMNTTSLSHLDAAGRTLYLYDSRGRDTAALVAMDLAGGEATVLAEDARADVDAMLIDGDTYAPIAWASGYERRRYHALDQRFAADIAALDAANIGDWSPASLTNDLSYWIVTTQSDTRPGVAWIYDRVSRRLEKLFESRPELAGASLARVHPVRIEARDGLEMVAYLSLPPASDKTAEAASPRTAAPLPLVLVVHGGPATRDHFGFDPEAQWLANRGYAVLKVNYRGSLGFGKAFLSAGNGQWGLAMSDNLDDAVDWAIAAGIADPARIAITGGSYGGYAVLAALTRAPDKYACGVDLVGPSDLETLIATIPPYWEVMRKAFLRSVGDPSTPDGLASLKDRSPLHRAGEIRRPLLIGHGANDPRVKQAEADQMAAAMQANGIPVTYALFSDEGHGFGRPENAICFAGLEESFLSLHLGGQAEALEFDALEASSMRLLMGGEGLVQASTAATSAP